MKFYKRTTLIYVSLFLMNNPFIHGLLLPERNKNKYIQKFEPYIKFAKKRILDFINNTDEKEEELKKKKEEYENRFSTWSYTRSLKYLEKNEEYQKIINQPPPPPNPNKNGKTNRKKHHYEENNKYKRYALNPESLMKGFPKYISEDINEAFKKRSSKRHFDDPVLNELYQNETQNYFTEDNFKSFNNYPKNISLDRNIVKVSIPFKNKVNQKIKRFLIQGNELLNNDNLKDARAFPLIDYDYENYMKNQEQNKVRYLKRKIKNSLDEDINSKFSRGNIVKSKLKIYIYYFF